MDFFSADYIIIGSFLLITLIIGLRASKGIKNIREYAIANKMYGTGILTMTLLATFYNGLNIGKEKAILDYGLVASFSPVGVAIMFIYMGLWIVPKMARYTNCITIGDIMKDLYGNYGSMITGLLGTFFIIFVVSAQFVAMGQICENMLGWKGKWVIIIGGFITVLYSSIGGIKSVTLTDIFQFLVFIIVIPIITNVAVSKTGGLQELFKQIPEKKMMIYESPSFLKYVSYFFSWALFPSIFVYPPIIQRVLMAKNKKQAKYTFVITGFIFLLLVILMTLTCFAVMVLAPNIKPIAGGATFYIMNQYLSPTLYNICIAGFFAIILSTIDSYLNSGGLLITQNIIKPLIKKNKTFEELKAVRYITFIIGILSIVPALMNADKKISLLAYIGVSLFVPVVTIPFVAGVLGLKTNAKNFLIASCITVSTFIIAKSSLTPNTSYLLLPITIITNAIAFLGMHYYKNKGFCMVSTTKISDEKIYRISLQAILKLLLEKIPTPQRITSYCHHKFKKYGANPALFAFFMLFNYTIPLFMHKTHATHMYTGLFLLKGVGALLCIGMFFKHYIPHQWYKYFPTYYYFTLLYCLPFFTTFLFLLGECNTEWIINIALAITFLIVLTDWVTFFILSFLGVFLAFISYQYWIGIPIVIQNSDTLYTLVYTIIFSTTIGLLFARRRQKTYDDLTLSNQHLQAKDIENTQELLFSFKEKIGIIKTLQQANIKKLPEIIKTLQSLRKEKIKITDQTLEKIEEKLMPMAFTLADIESRALNYLQLTVKNTTIQTMIAEWKKTLNVQKLKMHSQINTQISSITCDVYYMHQLFKNTVSLLKNQSKDHTIHLLLEETTLNYPLPSVSKDYIKKVKALALVISKKKINTHVESNYPGQLKTATENLSKTENTAMLLMNNNQRIIKAHYGYTDVCNPTQATHLYVIPFDLHTVRPKSMNEKQMQLGSTLVKANDQYPGAQAQEKKLLSTIKEKSQADLKKIHNALEIIKYYHGQAKRKSGEPFYLHPIAVAQIVLDYNQEEETILAALLHDTVEDTKILLESIALYFGNSVAKIVNGLTHLENQKNECYKINLAKYENINSLLSMKDPRVLYIKIADRLHNMRTLASKSYASQEKKAKETLSFFVPLAQYLQLEDTAQELKKRAQIILEKQ